MKIRLQNLFASVVVIAFVLSFNLAHQLIGIERTHLVAGFGLWKEGYIKTGWPLCIYHPVRQAAIEVVGTSTDGVDIVRLARYSSSLNPIAIAINTLVAISVSLVALTSLRLTTKFVGSKFKRLLVRNE